MAPVRRGGCLRPCQDAGRNLFSDVARFGRPMEGASEGVNQEMKESQAVAGFDYSDFEASIASFDSSFQVVLRP